MYSNNDCKYSKVVSKSKNARNIENKVEVLTKNHRNGLELQSSNTTSSNFASSSKAKESNKKNMKPFKETKKKQQVVVKQHIQMAEALKVDDFLAKVDQLKLRYPGSQGLWLKEVASFLNSALPFKSETLFKGKSINYPSCILHRKLKDAIENFLKEINEINLEYFFQILLHSLATDLSTGSHVFGYNCLFQLMAQQCPQICSNNLAKTAILRNSYQNRPHICRNILWAVGQGGLKQLNSGMTVWLNIMLPLIEMRYYTNFVCEYIEHILGLKYKISFVFNLNEFQTMWTALRTESYQIGSKQKACLQRSAETFLLFWCVEYCVTIDKLFILLLNLIVCEDLHDLELRACRQCMIKDLTGCLRAWKKNYTKFLVTSFILRSKIIEAKDQTLQNDEELQNFLDKIFNSMLDAHGYQFVKELYVLPKNGQEKAGLVQQKKRQNEKCKSGGCCKWMWGSLFVVALIAGALSYDTQVNGKGVFAKSAVGKVLKDAGALPYVETAWYTTMGAGARAYKWSEQHIPPYAKPALQLAVDLFKLARNAVYQIFENIRLFLQKKLPEVGKFLDQYVPGFSSQVEKFATATKNLVVDVYSKVWNFFQTQVFVGSLSPENLSKALNHTQNVASEYYNLFHKKVDAYAKLK